MFAAPASGRGRSRGGRAAPSSAARSRRTRRAGRARPRRAPSVRADVQPCSLRLDDRVDEQHQPARHRDRAGDVEAARAPRSSRDSGTIAEREHEDGDADRDVDEEDPRPREELRSARRRRPGRRRRRRSRSPPRRRAPSRARRLPANVVVMIASAAGEMNAAPRPCSARRADQHPGRRRARSSSDATVKTTRPKRNSRLRPSRSPARPPSSRKPPKTSV